MRANSLRKRPTRSMKSAALLLVFIAAAFVIAPAAGAEDPFLPSFGEGKVKVRLYTDYFCPPCRAMEPDIEPITKELVKDGIITLIFVDTPFYTYSSLYARYFLYSIYEKKDLEHALRVRRSLIEAAKNGLDSADRLEAFLKERGVGLKPFDPGSTFKVFSRHLKEDAVEATPSCVIETNGERKKYNGGGNIIEALKKLKKKQPGK